MWLEEWIIKPGDDTHPSSIKGGLDAARAALATLQADSGSTTTSPLPGAGLCISRMRSPRAGSPWIAAPQSISTPPTKAAALSRCCWPTVNCLPDTLCIAAAVGLRYTGGKSP